RGRVEVDPDDRFRLVGLEASDHDLIHVQRSRSLLSSMHQADRAGVRVAAPATGVELVSPMRSFSVVVTSEGEPVRDASVKFTFPRGGSVSGPTDREGVYSMILAVTDRTAYGLEISKPGFSSLRTEVAPAEIDDTRVLGVQIGRTGPAANVALTFVGPGGPLGPCILRLDLEGSPFYVYRDLGDAPETVDLGELPAGRYAGRLEPRVPLTRDPATLGRWLSTEFELDCSSGEPVHRRVELVAGGRVRLEVRDASRASGAPWSLAGPGDTRLHLLRWSALGARSEESFGGDAVAIDGAYWLRRPLAPGEYTLTIPRAAGAALVRRVHVVEGAVVTVDVDL
ncbi:MAG: hypothetical protein AAGB93_25785, partial [Planctomycetota bacterium]